MSLRNCYESQKSHLWVLWVKKCENAFFSIIVHKIIKVLQIKRKFEFELRILFNWAQSPFCTDRILKNWFFMTLEENDFLRFWHFYSVLQCVWDETHKWDIWCKNQFMCYKMMFIEKFIKNRIFFIYWSSSYNK